MDQLNELANQLKETFHVDPTALGEHPRYSKFKNFAKAAEQQAKRRQETLDRQTEGRFEKLIKLRNLAFDEFTDDDEDEGDNDEEEEEEVIIDHDMVLDYSKNKRRRRPRYADQLLLSEWLVDIPSSLSSEWTMMASPIGKRCLVVASKGSTTAYNKAGRIIAQFSSNLPGGSGKGKHKFTILDCIYSEKIYYVLDLLSWSESEYADHPFDLRQFMLFSKFEEFPEIGQISNSNKYPFVQLPTCKCSKEEMTRLLSQKFSFKLDGLLFYHSSVIYEPGQSPLVGWLKPWMLPEILGIPVPEEYQKDGEDFESSQQFIEKFNKRHGHHSQIDKSMET